MSPVSVAQALELVLEGSEPLPLEMAPLDEAHGRVLARDVAALRTQPPADLSAMDGYAVRGADVASAPAALKVIGEVPAGRPFSRRVEPGEAARIFTGGVVPEGADTVVIQELVERSGDDITVTRATKVGANVRRQGLDFTAGEVLLTAGRRLTGRDLGLAAAMNHPRLPVHRRPKVAILATGDELIPPGSDPAPGQIVYSNGFTLAALARSEGAELRDLGVAPDQLEATAAAVTAARDWGADVLVTAGGASVGEYDVVQQALRSVGLTLSFWRVALRPGRPLISGRIGSMRVLGVPGNPVSAFMCAFLFLVPLLRRLSGRSDLAPVPEPAVLGADLRANDGRADYLRATLKPGAGTVPVATPTAIQDSSMLSSLARADCLIVRAPNAPAAPAGSVCSIVKLGL